jgi:multiple sugar transport system substrate-binding protein
MVNKTKLSRRSLLRGSLVAGGAALLAACGATPAATTAPAAAATSTPAVGAPTTAAATEAATAAATEAATVAATGAAAATAAPSGNAVTIEVWHGFTGPDAETFKTMTEKWFYPLQPNIQVALTPDTVEDKLLPAISGGNPPDVSFGSVYSSLLLWGIQGAIVDVQPLIEKDQLDTSVFIQATYQAMLWKGKTYGLPFVNYNNGFYYNKAAFREAGLDDSRPPKDWTELADYAKKLTKKDASGNLTQLGWLPVSGTYDFAEVVLANGGHFIDKATGAITANSPKILEALEWEYKLASDLGIEQVNGFRSSFASGDDPFMLGKVAQRIDGDWYVAWSKRLAPTLDFMTGAMPANDPAFFPSNDVLYNSTVICNGAKHQAEGWTFLKWMTTDVELSKQFALSVGNLPQLKAAVQGWSPDPRLQVFLDISNSPHAEYWAAIPAANKYDTELNNAISSVYAGKATPKDALDAVQQVVTEEQAKYA